MIVEKKEGMTKSKNVFAPKWKWGQPPLSKKVKKPICRPRASYETRQLQAISKQEKMHRNKNRLQLVNSIVGHTKAKQDSLIIEQVKSESEEARSNNTWLSSQLKYFHQKCDHLTSCTIEAAPISASNKTTSYQDLCQKIEDAIRPLLKGKHAITKCKLLSDMLSTGLMYNGEGTPIFMMMHHEHVSNMYCH